MGGDSNLIVSLSHCEIYGGFRYAQPTLLAPLAHLFGQPRQVMGGVAEAVLDDHAAAEIVTDCVFLGHADAAMQLHCVLRHETRRLADPDLDHRDVAGAL